MLLVFPTLPFPGVGNFHHLYFFAPLVGLVHFKHVGVVIYDPGHRTPLQRAFDGVVVTAFLCNGLAIHARRPFKNKEGGAHGIHPG
jgi:hypothetical protein